MAHITLAPYAPADFDPLARLWRDSVGLMGLDTTPIPEMDFFFEKLGEVVTACEVTVARSEGRIAGFLAVLPDKAVLEQIFLAPDCLRKGIGSRLFALARERMPGGFTLYTPSSNARAKAFYEAQGMDVSHEGRHPVWGHPVTHYVWRP